MSVPEPRAHYLQSEAEHRQARDRAHAESLRIGTVRLLTFLALTAALVLVDVWEGAAERVAMAASIALLAAFVAEVRWHRRTRRREAWHEALRALAHEGILRLERRWRELEEALPAGERVREEPPTTHPYARDLDVLGEASLVRLLGAVTTELGRAELRSWLVDPPPLEVALGRHDGVRELAALPELRAELAAHGRIGALPRPRTIEPFLAWAERKPWMGSGLRWAAWILPALSIGLGIGSFWLGWPPLWALPALGQIEVLRRTWRRIHAELAVVEEAGLPLQAYGPQMAVVEGASWSSGALRALARRLGGGNGEPASRELRRLARLLDTVESRRNMFYVIFAPILLVEVHLAAALDRWRGRAGASVRGWLEALGTVEALSALATTAYDHPGWCYPGRAPEGEKRLRAEAIGHPLLRPDLCVCNDVEVGPPGRFLLVTGSNMSGKSTLLRALGANVVLARAGGPVCARALTVPEVRVCTSMRVEDSVTEGVSLFMAELLRIRDVVRAADEPEEAPVLFLLDEILHGTNTAERRVAARAVIRHLLARDAIGAVSTHDLTLAAAPDLQAAADDVHFREQVVAADGGRTRLTFDYRLRPGLATTRNALKLLDAVGLGGLEGLDEEVEETPSA